MPEPRSVFTLKVSEGAPVEFFALLNTLSGRLAIVPADVTSIAFTLHDVTTRTMVLLGGVPWTLVPATVIEASVKTSDVGYPYKEGYNFSYVLPSGYTVPGGRRLVAEFLFVYVATDNDDVPTAIPREVSYRWDIEVAGRRGVT